MNNRYSIYPSLLDSYCYMQSLEDADDRAAKKQELIDKLNRVKQPTSEAASRGTAINEIIDSRINGVPPANGVTYTASGDTYVAELDGFTFTYDKALVDALCDEFLGSLSQVFTSAEIEVAQGVVTLYGFADYVRDSEVIDLKTTSTYNVGKFRDHWQHLVYPYCLVKSGAIEDFDIFRYLIAEIRKGRDGIIRAELYHEDYNPSMDEIETRIRRFLQYEFIPFLEDNRNLITGTKIFS